MASSSDSSSSSESSSASSNKEGFAFDGSVYATYQEMVDAKRERNRKVLEKSVDELSTVLGSDFNASKNTDNESRQSDKNKRKRRGSNQSAGGSSRPLRRNPTRSARSTTSSISSQSHASSSFQSSIRSKSSRKNGKNRSSLDIPIPAIPDGEKELREPCPQIGPGWEMRVRARKRVSINKQFPTVDRVFIAPNGKVLRSLNEVDRFLEGESIISGNDADAISSIGDAASIISLAQSQRTKDALQQSPVPEHTATTNHNATSTAEETKELQNLDSTHVTDQSTLPKYIFMKDMSTSLEHILLNGGRVQAREAIWKDFVQSDTVLGNNDPIRTETANGKKGASKRKRHSGKVEVQVIESANRERLIHESDSKLYREVIDHTEQQLSNSCENNANDAKAQNDKSRFRSCFGDIDDIEIPEEFIVRNNVESKSDPTQQYLKMMQEKLPLDDPVKYNNIVRERHSYYTSKGPDRHWDEEYGDGIDPMMFVEECCRGDANATGGDVNRSTDNGDESYMAKQQYTSSLLQRCWDRAVHAASSTVAVNMPDMRKKESKSNLEANIKTGIGDMTVLKNKEVATSILHSEAINTVDGLLDILLSKDNNLMQMLDNPKAGNKSVDWRHVLKCLKAAEKVKQKETASCPEIPLNSISLKALAMRLIERYGTRSHKMPG